jgi:hypothetical protein
LGDGLGDMGHGSGTGPKLSVRTLAAALGVSKSQVHRDALAGMPVHSVDAAREWRSRVHDVSRTVDGRIDRPQLSLRQEAPPLPFGRSDAPLESPGAVEVPPAPPEAPEDAPQPGDTAEYRKARAERERTRAEREALELEQLRGKLIAVDEASRIAFTAFRALRDAIENVPARIKDQVAAEPDPFHVERIMAAELTSVLQSFDVAAAVSEPDDEDDDT